MRSTARLVLAIGLVALFVQSALAHTYLSSVVLGGTKLAEGDCVRSHPTIEFDSPISSITSADMTCGFLPSAGRAANRRCPIAAGSTIGLQWHHNNNGPSDDILDPTHKGPVLFYLSKTNDGSGNSWFKIYEDGYNPSTQTWATDKLVSNRGIVTITIPSDIEAGNYLLRGEILALHNAYYVGGVQPYVGCVELTISGEGKKNPSANGVAFPGAYKASDEGLNLDVYHYYPSYKIPGPALYVAGPSSTTGSSTPTVKPPTTPAPTNAPTSAPTIAPTSTPTITPTSAPSGSIKLQMNGGSSVWWLGVIVTGGSQTTVKVEIKDAGSVSSWTSLVDMSYAYIYDKGVQLTLPISVRLTSSSRSEVIIENAFTSWTFSQINTYKDFGTGSTSAPTKAPTSAPTTAPTYAPTSAPTTAPTSAPTATPTTTPTSAPTSRPTSAPGGSFADAKLTVFSGASQWWFACILTGVSGTIPKVEFKDATMTNYLQMSYQQWGYSVETRGSPFVAPVTVRVTNAAYQTASFTFSSITPNLQVAAN